MKPKLLLPAALAVTLLASCEPNEPEPHPEFCYCESMPSVRADAGPNAPDSGCVPPQERVCETV